MNLMSLNWFIILVLGCIGLALTNPDHSQHHAALSPVFLEHVEEVRSEDPTLAEAAWTYLPKKLAYQNYHLFSTSSFPGGVATAQTPAEGVLTLGVLGNVIVLFPKSS
jgi:hypothetical protein